MTLQLVKKCKKKKNYMFILTQLFASSLSSKFSN